MEPPSPLGPEKRGRPSNWGYTCQDLINEQTIWVYLTLRSNSPCSPQTDGVGKAALVEDDSRRGLWVKSVVVGSGV